LELITNIGLGLDTAFTLKNLLYCWRVFFSAR